METVNKEKTDKALDNAAVQQETKAASTIDLGAIPLLSTPDDVNGFRSIQKPKVKKKILTTIESNCNAEIIHNNG